MVMCNKPNQVLIVFNWLFGNAGQMDSTICIGHSR